MLFDCDHWPGSSKGRQSSLFHCQLTHGTVFSKSTCRIATGKDHLFAQGIDICAPDGDRFESCTLPFVEALKRTDQILLAGIGMHLTSYRAWMLYVLCNCRRRPRCDPHDVLVHNEDSESDADQDEVTDELPSPSVSPLGPEGAGCDEFGDPVADGDADFRGVDELSELFADFEDEI